MKNKKIVIVGISTLLVFLLIEPQVLHAMSERPPRNYPPIAVIDSIVPNPATHGEEVIFTGYGVDRDGSIIAYKWRSHIDNYLSTSSSFSTNTLSVGNHSIYFMVQDDDGAWSNEISRVLTVTSANRAPVLSSIGNKVITECSPLNFTISAIDPDGDTLTYAGFNLPPGASFNTTVNAFNWTPGYDQAGTYSGVHFEVTDGQLLDSEDITIAVNGVIIPPFAGATGRPTSGEAPLVVIFSASATDPDGTITGYGWNFGDGGTSTQQNPTYTYNNSGSYVAALTVTDNDGATETDTVTITVNEAANQAPTVQASASPTSGEAPLDVQFTGQGQDPNGTIAGYSWDFGDGATSNEQNPSHTYNSSSTYIVTLTVTDDDGLRASSFVEISVRETLEPAIPQLIRFQARLEDAQGAALDGIFSLTFRLYDTDIGGEPIWEEIQDAYVEEGILDVKLGSVSTLDLPFDQQYWLGVEVGSDGEMSPRFEFTSVPYSFKSAQ